MHVMLQICKVPNIKSIDYPKYGNFRIFTTNNILNFRAESFLKKEPTTLEWMQNLESDSILIDVGANIGIYTIPSALFHVKKVIAIEPEIRNYNMLLDNIELNGLNNQKVEALPLAISTKFAHKSTKIYLTSDDVGASCHQVGRSQNHLLEAINPIKRKSRSVYCIPLSEIVQQIDEYHSGPIHIKIDVDGIEEDVCQSLFDDKVINRIASLQIELNQAIASHQRLIDRLASAGYFFSDEQVEKSRRKSGNFEGFAEIVFKRSLLPECGKTLKKEFADTLGSNHSPIQAKSLITPTTSGFYTLNDSMTTILSKQPSSYAFKNAFNANLCANLFHQIANSIIKSEDASFKFTNQGDDRSTSSLRRLIRISTIKKISPNYINELSGQATSSKVVSEILKIVRHASQFTFSKIYMKKFYADSGNEKLKGKHLICRIRHFLDLHGYSLDIHHDSHDTFCALVAPLIPYSTSTSIVNGGLFDRSYNRKPEPQNLQQSDFRNNHFIDIGASPNTYVSYQKNAGEKILYAEIPSTYTQADLKPGEIFAIPNMRSYAFGDLRTNQNLQMINYNISQTMGHGVLPFVKEPYRVVTLIDYMLTDPHKIGNSNDDQIIIDIGRAIELLR